MSPTRNALPADVAAELGIRPLTARSVLLSTLLGLDPPVLPGHRLVATAGLFGIAEGTARVALSRMTTAGELVAENGHYRLADRFLARQRRQTSGRRPGTAGTWRGGWHVLVVAGGRRPAAARAELRDTLRDGRLAEWREGVWARPDNLPRPDLADHLAGACTWATARPDVDGAAFAATLWDLDGWARITTVLLAHLTATAPALASGDVTVLAPGFVLSAAVLRHLAADPLLPTPLLPPRWPGDELRAVYDDWDRGYRAVLASWHREGAPPVRRSST